MDKHTQAPSSVPQPSPSTTDIAPRKVLLAGATGLVGGFLLRGLLDDATVGEVHALVRRELAIRHPKLVTHQVDFRAIPLLPPVDEAYLALGTTIRQAGSQAAFRAVDFEANLAVAKAALAAGAKRIGLVSANGASVNSSIFYSRIKGELEDALTSLAPETLVIARPSYLLGDRDSLQQAVRNGEKVGIWLSNLLGPLLPAHYRPVEAQRVANGLLAKLPSSQGKVILMSGDLQHFTSP